VEAQNLHALDGLQAAAEIGRFLYVVVAFGEARHQDVTYPHRTSQRRQPARVIERRLQRLSRDFLVDVRVARLDVEEVEVNVH
jgi:hypothetical protein